MKNLLAFSAMCAAALCSTQTYAAVGRTAGQFAVSQTGSAQYTIPIWAPPGPRGMQPNISLFYDSRSLIGPLGVGWSIAGLGEITRCNKTVAQDGTAAPVALVTGDGYCINGNRLRITSGTYGTAGSVYQTEIADFSQITANGTAGNNGPAYFTVQGRNGLTYYYGYTDSNGNGQNSQVLANGTSTALSWLLSKVVDRAGNNYVINYTTLSGTLIGTALPNTIYWTPTSAGASSYSYTMQFNYTANVPQSSINKYVGGTNVSNTQMLSSIEVFYGSTLVKDYFLGYQPSSSTAREELVTIQECADVGKSNCLSPTSVTYQTGTAGVSSTASTALSASGTNVTARYDLNGDGIPDLVYYNGTAWYVAFGTSSGAYQTAVNTNITARPGTFLPGNLNGATQDGILANNGGTWYYYTWNGTSFAGTSTGLAYDGAAQYQLADINGDGRADLIGLYFTGSSGNYTVSVDFRLNTSSGSTISFSSTLTTGYTWTGLTAAFLQTPDSTLGKLRHYDFNGDGLDDLAITIAGGILYSTYELITTPNGTNPFTPAFIAYGGNVASLPMLFVNWNDDKCTDIAYEATLYISGCNGTVPAQVSLSGDAVAAMDWDADGRIDLLVDTGANLVLYQSTGGTSPVIVTTTVAYNGNCLYLAMDTSGTGLDDLGCWIQQSPNSISYYAHNGITDLASKFQDGYGNSASPTYISLTQGASTGAYKNNTNASYPYANYISPTMYVVDLVTFSDPSSQSATYNIGYSYYWAWMNLQGRGFAGFDDLGIRDSRTPTLMESPIYRQDFPFTGMPKGYQIWEKGTGHFNNPILQTSYTLATTELSNTQYEQRYFAYASNATTENFELVGPPGTANDYLITTNSTGYTYDNYGNVTNITTIITDNDPNSPYTGKTWTTGTTNTTDISANQSADLAAWCLNMLDETQVTYSSTLSGSTSVTRTKTFTPDTPTACRIKTAVTEPTANSGLYKVTEALTFDSFGNTQTDTVTGANMPSSPASRELQLNWGTTGQFLNSATDPSNATTSWTYTSNQSLTFGVPDSVKNPNNLTTSWLYDAFGRKTNETRPDSSSTTWTWSTCTSYCGWSNSVYQIAQTAYQTNGSTVIRTDTNFYDPIDRVTETSGPTVTGATGIVQRLYNPLGLLAQQSMPFLSGGTAYQQSYGYDVLNRLIESERPVNASSGQTYCNPTTVPPTSGCQGTAYAYAGRTRTVTDPLGNTKTTITDVNGWLRQTKDPKGYNITRSYDSAGSLIGITDSVGNTLLSGVSYKYGIKPFRVADSDADRGAWTYTVDSLGERTGWTDAKGQSFSMTYDALSRPSTRTEPITSQDPGLFTQWQWGSTPASYSVGQLISECTVTGNPTTCGSSPQYSETRTFDTLGRLSTRSITESGNPGNDPGGVFLFTHAYSTTTGLLNTLTYPKSTSSFALALQYGYGYGLLSSVTDTSDTTGTCGSTCVLWTANSMNSFGEITQETLGNGVVTNRSFDGVTSWLSAATAGVGGGAGLLNQSYLEDKDGNVIQRQDGVHSLTENFYYDADNRLCAAVLGGTGGCSTPTFAYDGGAAGPGNITTQTGVGTYTYPAAGQPRPHAVTSITGTFNGITNPTFSYDANGNMTNRASSSANITWSSYNYPTVISGSDATGSEEVQLSYGPDRQRWKQIYTGPSGTETTYYIGGLVDLVFNGTTNYRQYIYAGSEPVAIYSRTSAGVNTMSYFLEDHQGGISGITSNAGAVDIDESFTVFGQRRNPTTWSGAPTTSDLNTIAGLSRQGYTFQTWLGQSMGLNHMNGRMQDAILGRFLSPDPHVPDKSNAQSYNRYSYVNNNPLTYSDPSGFYQPLHFVFADGGDIGPPGISIGTLGQWTYFSGGSQWNGDLLQGPPPSNPGTSAPDNTGSAASVAATTTDGSGSSVDPGAPTSDPASPASPAQSGGCVGSPCAPQSPTDPDTTILNPPSFLGTDYTQTLQVQLNPGNNQLMLSATNLDCCLASQLWYWGGPTVNITYTLFVNANGVGYGPTDPAQFTSNPAPGGFAFSPSSGPGGVGPLGVQPVSGQTAFTTLGYYQGPGAATITLTQAGYATLGIIFSAQPVPSH